MWELDYKESWVLKNWFFWTVVLEKTLESPLDCKEINQSILKEISPEYSMEGLMLKLKLQYLGLLMWRADSLEKTLSWERLKAGEGDNRGWDGWMASLTWWTWVWESSGSWWWTGKSDMLQSMGSQRVRHDWVTEQMSSKLLCLYAYIILHPSSWLMFPSGNFLNVAFFKAFFGHPT